MLSHFIQSTETPDLTPFTGSEIDHIQDVLDSLDGENNGCPDRDCDGVMNYRRYNEPQCHLLGEFLTCDCCGEIDFER
jgi:hypothetical protein